MSMPPLDGSRFTDQWPVAEAFVAADALTGSEYFHWMGLALASPLKRVCGFRVIGL